MVRVDWPERLKSMRVDSFRVVKSLVADPVAFDPVGVFHIRNCLSISCMLLDLLQAVMMNVVELV